MTLTRNPLPGGSACGSPILKKKRRTVMFARIGEFIPKLEQKDEFVKVVRNEVLPILKQKTEFMDILPLFRDTNTEKMTPTTLWAEKRDAERYEREPYSKVEGILKPYLTTPVTFKHYNVETSVCQHLVEALTA